MSDMKMELFSFFVIDDGGFGRDRKMSHPIVLFSFFGEETGPECGNLHTMMRGKLSRETNNG
jgi:hypothetical protein